jgi:hypothetical protein
MPDNGRGFVKRHKGIQRPDTKLTAKYRSRLSQDVVAFDETVQRSLLAGTLAASEFQEFRCHYLATESTHVHVLVSWNGDRDWQTIRAKLGESLTRQLNRKIKRQHWFSKSPSRKRVKDRKHFDYLVTMYLPKHSGLKWCKERGIFR